MVPAGTPAAVVNRLNAAMMASANAPELQEKLLFLGTSPALSSPEAFDQFLRREREKLGKIIQAAHITSE